MFVFFFVLIFFRYTRNKKNSWKYIRDRTSKTLFFPKYRTILNLRKQEKIKITSFFYQVKKIHHLQPVLNYHGKILSGVRKKHNCISFFVILLINFCSKDKVSPIILTLIQLYLTYICKIEKKCYGNWRLCRFDH